MPHAKLSTSRMWG